VRQWTSFLSLRTDVRAKRSCERVTNYCWHPSRFSRGCALSRSLDAAWRGAGVSQSGARVNPPNTTASFVKGSITRLWPKMSDFAATDLPLPI
jgi:hypothetical protein